MKKNTLKSTVESLILATVVLASLSTGALAQSQNPRPADGKAQESATEVTQSLQIRQDDSVQAPLVTQEDVAPERSDEELQQRPHGQSRTSEVKPGREKPLLEIQDF